MGFGKLILDWEGSEGGFWKLAAEWEVFGSIGGGRGQDVAYTLKGLGT
jgi:hypothetical protein